jgi:hypothetical protein
MLPIAKHSTGIMKRASVFGKIKAGQIGGGRLDDDTGTGREPYGERLEPDAMVTCPIAGEPRSGGEESGIFGLVSGLRIGRLPVSSRGGPLAFASARESKNAFKPNTAHAEQKNITARIGIMPIELLL